MSSSKIFFSYSRIDSSFALRLARDIREAGVDLWIDQLDIPAGNHWDAAVEKALIASSCVLVILSPASTASNNVKDEISFALDTGKKIIPVLLEECMAPFRIRRLQHIDFSKDYNTGLKQLIAAVKRATATTPKTPKPELAEVGEYAFAAHTHAHAHDEQIHDAQLWDDAYRLNTVAGYTTIADLEKQEKPDQLVRSKTTASKILVKKSAIARQNVFIGAGVIMLALVLGFVGNVSSVTKHNAINQVMVETPTLIWQTIIDSMSECKRLEASAAILVTSPVKQKKDSIATHVTASSKQVAKQIAKSKFSIGQQYEGGIIVYINSTGTHGLIVADKDLGSMQYEAAMRKCLALKSNGFDDWRLPSKDELNRIYHSKKFLGTVAKGMYWAMAESADKMAWTQDLSDGHLGNFNKGMTCSVRAVRSF